MTDQELHTLLSAARRKILGQATPGEVRRLDFNTLHAMWDVIFDGDALLRKEPTICDRATIEQYLREFVT